jgi:hypothetical protein
MLNKIRGLFSPSFPNSIEIKDKELINEVIKINRATLAKVPEWLNNEIKSQSYFNYGVPDEIYPLLSLDIGNDVTYTDLIIYFSKKIKKINYLELGVSVGKNFFQVASQFENASLTGFDIENINPILQKEFHLGTSRSWETMSGSVRKEKSTYTTYQYKSNQLNYLAGDIWDERSWAELKGNKFNIIFSDALHDPKALLWEYEMIQKYELLAPEFVFFWDDLNHGLEQSFFQIAKGLKRKFDLKTSNIRLIKINGWLGKNYPIKHDVGIVSNLF